MSAHGGRSGVSAAQALFITLGVFVTMLTTAAVVDFRVFPLGTYGAQGERCYIPGICREGLRCWELDRWRRGLSDEEPLRKTCVHAGGAFELCGTGGACAAGLSCVGDRCIEVGGEDEPCRADGACDPGLACFTGKDLHGNDYQRCAAKVKVASIAAGGGRLCLLAEGGEVRCLDTTSTASASRMPDYPAEANPHCVASDLGEVRCGPSPMQRPRVVPRPVEGFGAGVRLLSVGYLHACAVTVAGAVKCWGYNDRGQLGDGTRSGSETPVDVAGLGGPAAAVAAGGAHTCALLDDGRARCWGANDQDQLGDGSPVDQVKPVDAVVLRAGMKAITAGASFTCAVGGEGSVLCWGRVKEGWPSDRRRRFLGNVPSPVEKLVIDVRAISAGADDLCAVHADGKLECVGYRFPDTLGSFIRGCESCGFSSDCIMGARGLFDVSVEQVSAGEDHACAVTQGGKALCWGPRLSYGECAGDGWHGRRRYPPMAVPDASTAAKGVAVGAGFACVLTAGGAVLCLDIGRCDEETIPGAGAQKYDVSRKGKGWDSKRPVCPPPTLIPGTGP